MRRCWLILLCGLLLPSLALAGEPKQTQKTDPQARTAQRYGFAAWPAASAARAGVSPHSLKATGWTRVSLRLDARRAEATVGFAPASGASKTKRKRAAQVRAQLRLHATAKAARRALLGFLGACQATLTREPGYGDVAFGVRGRAGLTLLAAVRGNVTFVARGSGAADLAAASDLLVRSSAALEPGQSVPTPRLLALRTVAPAKVGATKLRLDFAPGSPQPLGVVITSSAGGVLRTRGGYTLYVTKPGRITLRVVACSKLLQVGTRTVTLDVAPN